MKKFVSMFLALAMCLSLAAPAFAAEEAEKDFSFSDIRVLETSSSYSDGVRLETTVFDGYIVHYKETEEYRISVEEYSGNVVAYYIDKSVPDYVKVYHLPYENFDQSMFDALHTEIVSEMVTSDEDVEIETTYIEADISLFANDKAQEYIMKALVDEYGKEYQNVKREALVKDGYNAAVYEELRLGRESQLIRIISLVAKTGYALVKGYLAWKDDDLKSAFYWTQAANGVLELVNTFDAKEFTVYASWYKDIMVNNSWCYDVEKTINSTAKVGDKAAVLEYMGTTAYDLYDDNYALMVDGIERVKKAGF